MAVDIIARGMAANATHGGSGGSTDTVILHLVTEAMWQHLDKTWQEINNDLYDGKRVVVMLTREETPVREVLQMPVVSATYNNELGHYEVFAMGPQNAYIFGYASYPNDYPTVN